MLYVLARTVACSIYRYLCSFVPIIICQISKSAEDQAETEEGQYKSEGDVSGPRCGGVANVVLLATWAEFQLNSHPSH